MPRGSLSKAIGSLSALMFLVAQSRAQNPFDIGGMREAQERALRISAWPEWARNLPDSLQHFFLGLAIWQWLALVALLLISLFIGYIARSLATASLRARYKVPGLEFSQGAKRGTRRAVAIIVAAIIWRSVLTDLGLPGEAEALIYRLIDLSAVLALIWLGVSLWNAFCDYFLHRSESVDKRTERLLVPVTRKFVTAVIMLGGALLVLAVVGVPVVSIVAYLGIGGLAVALAAKDSVENVFGSLTILFDMPFALGDWVKIDKVEGIVEQINLRSTRIRTFEDSLITLPNSNLIKASVENFGARRYRRQKFNLRFSHDSDPNALEKFVDDYRAKVKAQSGVVNEKTVVEINDLTEQWIGVLVICHLDATASVDEMKVRSKLMIDALRLAKERNLKFAAATAVATLSVAPEPEPAESSAAKVE